MVSGHTAQSSLVVMTIKTVVYNTTRHCSGSLIADCQRSRVGTFERRTQGPGLPLQGNAAAALRDAASRGRLEPFHRAASQAWPVARHAAVLGCADGGGGEAGAARARALHRNAVDNAGPCVDEARGPDLLGAECSLLELSVLYGRFHGQASLLGTWAFTFGKAAVRCGAAQALSSWT